MPKNNPSILWFIAMAIAIFIGVLSKEVMDLREEWGMLSFKPFLKLVFFDFIIAGSVGMSIAGILYGVLDVHNMVIFGVVTIMSHNFVRVLAIFSNLIELLGKKASKKVDDL